MDTNHLLAELEQMQLITSETGTQLQIYERSKPVSLFFFLRGMLYLGITALTTGAGILIYQHIDTLGHTLLMVALGLLTAGGFAYAFRKGKPFSPGRVEHTEGAVDTAVLLGSLLFLALEAYAQYQFTLFGTRYGLAVFLPALLFLYIAYRFDHQGVLSLGLTALASWVGLTATPNEILVSNDFSQPWVIYTALLFGIVVVGISYLLEKLGIKKHFSYTYLLVGGTLYLCACLGGLFTLDSWQLLFGLLLGLGCYVFYQKARQDESLLFLLISVLFGYTGITYLLFHNIPLEIGVAMGSLYFLLSAAGVVWFFLNFKKLIH